MDIKLFNQIFLIKYNLNVIYKIGMYFLDILLFLSLSILRDELIFLVSREIFFVFFVEKQFVNLGDCSIVVVLFLNLFFLFIQYG